MKLTSRATRRIAATTAAACTAIVIPTVALAAPAPSAAPPAQAAPKCAASQLTAWIGVPGEGTAGTVHYQLELSNISHHTCALLGFPGVSPIGRHGRIGHPALRDHTHKSRLITLRRGGTAHVELGIGNVSGFPHGACDPVTAEGLKVYPPNDRRAEIVDFRFQTCKKHGRNVANLSISPTIGATGIPLFSS